MFLYSHPDCLGHDVPGHPERPDRVRFALAYLSRTERYANWQERLAEPPALDSFADTHTDACLAALRRVSGTDGLHALDPDTYVMPATSRAALAAAGAVLDASLTVMQSDTAGPTSRAFCVVRPPGHHAERDAAMGFCYLNSVAHAATTVTRVNPEARVAILDFDVHHGNGTVDICAPNDRIMVCSSFQYPFYPHRFQEVVAANVCNTPLQAGTGSAEFRSRVEQAWSRALTNHRPDLILVSAGFDGHRADPLAGLALETEDYAWLGALIRSYADEHCHGRVVGALEGGYDLVATAESLSAFLDSFSDP